MINEGQWMWMWLSCQRPEVRIQSSAKFYNTVSWITVVKTKIKKTRPAMSHLKRTLKNKHEAYREIEKEKKTQSKQRTNLKDK